MGSNATKGNITSTFQYYIWGALPKWIKGMNLYELDLSHNQINGTLPIFPSNFTHVDLSHNLISGVLPEMIENNLKGRIPLCIDDLTRMVLPQTDVPLTNLTLDAYNYRIGAEVMKGRFLEYKATVLSLLVNLDLSRNKLGGQIPEELTFLKGLIGLKLSHNQLSGTMPKKIGELEMLESLDCQ
ncbi:hypothetical protein REPUB_Repub08aG0124000 [Reevesia pubescens]